MEKKDKEFAFWRDNQFPYVLGAEVIGKKEEFGKLCIEAKGYETYRFYPIVVMPLDEGLLLQKKLHSLKAERELTLDSIYKGFKARLKEIFPNALDN